MMNKIDTNYNSYYSAGGRKDCTIG